MCECVVQNVKTTGEQIEWTSNWYKEVRSLVGQERGDYIIKNTLHIISTGANDWVNNYYVNPTLLKQYTPETYTTFIIGKARAYIQVLTPHFKSYSNFLVNNLSARGGGQLTILFLITNEHYWCLFLLSHEHEHHLNSLPKKNGIGFQWKVPKNMRIWAVLNTRLQCFRTVHLKHWSDYYNGPLKMRVIST